MKKFVLSIFLLVASLATIASAQTAPTVVKNTQGFYCGYYYHGPNNVPSTYTCQAPTASSSVALEAFYEGDFSAAAYPGYTTPTFALYSYSIHGYCSGVMTGNYSNGQVIATFTGTCADGALFTGKTTQYIAMVRHREGGGRVGIRWVTSYLITSGTTTIN